VIESPGILLTVLAFALVIGPLIFLHEMGHYLAGRLFGVKIDVFSIGFGNELFGVTDRRGTRWKFSWLPLGGYVKFAGDMNAASVPDHDWLMLPPEERARTLQGRPVWQRMIVVAAGPVANFIVAIVLLTGFIIGYGDFMAPPVAGTVVAGSPAAVAGIRPDDRITTFDGRAITTFSELAALTQPSPGKTATLTVEREGVSRTVTVRIGAQTVQTKSGKTLHLGLLGLQRRPVGLIEAPFVGVQRTFQITGMMAQGLGQIFVGQRSVKELGGPLKIAQVSGQQLALGWDSLIWLIAMISINLGFINLLPVPILDGGHLFFYAIEWIRRRPVPPQVQEWAFRGGLAAILALMVMTTFNDLDSFGLWKNLRGLIG
jgi:regulator of sigma E protease